MFIKTPILTSILPFESIENATFRFSYSDTMNQMIRNNLVIEENITGKKVYDQEIPSLIEKHQIPSGTLTDGIVYRAKIRVANINNEWSSFSDYIVFYVLKKPIVVITNLVEESVNSQNVIFSASYSHPNNEILQSFEYLLYDENKKLIKAFPMQYSDGKTSLDQSVVDLKADSTYYIQIAIETVHFQKFITDYRKFKVNYTIPAVNTQIGLNNKNEQGAIEISANVKFTVFKAYDFTDTEITNSNSFYQTVRDHKSINLNDSTLNYIKADFLIDKDDFFLQIWSDGSLPITTTITDIKPILKLSGSMVDLNVFLQNNSIHVLKKYVNSKICNHWISDEVANLSSISSIIVVKFINGLCDIIIQS